MSKLFQKTAALMSDGFLLSEDVDNERKEGGSSSDSLVNAPHPPLFTNLIEAFKFQNSTFQKVDRYVSHRLQSLTSHIMEGYL